MTVDQATRLRELVTTSRSRARVVAVTSGKGGVGKSSFALNLAAAAAPLHARTVLVDADLGLANLDVMCGENPAFSLADVVSGRKRLDEVAVRTGYRFDLVPGASGISHIADLPDGERARLLSQLEALEGGADLVVIDTGAGVSRNVIRIAAAADIVYVLTTPEPTSITDAYAAIKLLSRCREHGRIRLVVNQASSGAEAARTASRITNVCRRFLSLEVESAGWIASDPKVAHAVRLRRPLVAAFPASPAAISIRRIARALHGADGNGSAGGFISRLGRLLGR